MKFSKILMGLTNFTSGLKLIKTYAHTLALALQAYLLGEEFIWQHSLRPNIWYEGDEALPFLKYCMSRWEIEYYFG